MFPAKGPAYAKALGWKGVWFSFDEDLQIQTISGSRGLVLGEGSVCYCALSMVLSVQRGISLGSNPGLRASEKTLWLH